MSIQIRDTSCYKKKSEPCWNDMEELKYLICMIDRWYARNIELIETIKIICVLCAREINGELLSAISYNYSFIVCNIS